MASCLQIRDIFLRNWLKRILYRADHATGIVLTNTKSHFEAMRSTATIIQAKGRFHSKKQLINLFTDSMSQTYET